MRYLVTAAQMKRCDENTSEHFHIPPAVLMERAALASMQIMGREIPHLRQERILILCGGGNNGGDGLALARLLHLKGFRAHFCMLAKPKEGTLPAEQYAAAKAFGVREILLPPEAEDLEDFLAGYTLFADAVFGTGLSRDIEGEPARVIEAVNRVPGLKVALDLPSGVCADDGRTLGPAFRADLTITFAFEKLGSVFYPGAEFCGRQICCDIGITEAGFEGQFPDTKRFSKEDLGLIPARKADSHKGSYGKVLVIGGSEDMGGAAYFSGRAAYRTGAGLVRIFTVEENRDFMKRNLPEAILTTVTDGKADEAMVREAICWADVVVLGPGLSLSPLAEKLVRMTIEILTGKDARIDPVPLIIDGDALTILAGNEDLQEMVKGYCAPGPDRDDSVWIGDVPAEKVSKIAGSATVAAQEVPHVEVSSRTQVPFIAPDVPKADPLIILTPHMKEMSRLTGRDIPWLKEHRMEIAREYAETYGVTLVMKDSRTVTALPDGQLIVNTSGNSGLATAGSGDVLTGVIAGLLATHTEAVHAAALGVWIHGMAGETAADRLGESSVMASDLADAVGEVLQERREADA